MQTEIMITATYNSAKNTAIELETIASDLLKLTNMEYENVLVALSGVWQGENSERFIQKGRIVKEHLLDTVKEIRNAATELRNDAKATYDADMKKLEITREKTKDEVDGAGVRGGGDITGFGGGSRGDSRISERSGIGSFGGGRGGSR